MNDMVKLSNKEFQLFCQFIYDHAGVKLHEGKSALVSSRLHKRLVHHGLSSFGDYYRLITGKQANKQEQQLAIDLLTTNETYFFREPKHFDFLAKALPKLGQVSVWSAASSTGEEAYSVAMLLASLGLRNWQVLGTDINHTVLNQARQAVYPISAADQIAPELLKKYCLKGIKHAHGTLRIASEIRRQVSFQPANLRQSQAALGEFDVVFLRNVMIYFDQATKQQVLDHVSARIKPGGYFLLGHAESLNGLTHPLKLIQPAVYQKVL